MIWLQGAGCTGCSVSFLNLISPAAPRDAAEVLINHVNLVYHPNVMSAAGEMAVAAAEQAFNTGGYILVVEGGDPHGVRRGLLLGLDIRRPGRDISGGGYRPWRRAP